MKSFITHAGTWAPIAEQKAATFFLQDIPALHSFPETFRHSLYERLQLFYDGIKGMKAAGLRADAIATEEGVYLSVKIILKDAHNSS